MLAAEWPLVLGLSYGKNGVKSQAYLQIGVHWELQAGESCQI